MKRKGFTLSEVLISIGIVGIIAAIMLPMVNKYRPDENKIKYLKAYNSLMELMPVVVNNRKAYPLMNSEDGVVYNEYPLLNTTASIEIDGIKYSGVEKFCRLVAMGMNTTGTISCPSTYDTSAIPDFQPSFETVDGTQFMIQTLITSGTYKSDIYIDVNGAKGENCFATNSSCKNVDRFKLMVGGDGKIHIADARGKYYLDTRTNWKWNPDVAVFGPLSDSLLTAYTEIIPLEPEPEPEPKPEPEPEPKPDIDDDDDDDANAGSSDVDGYHLIMLHCSDYDEEAYVCRVPMVTVFEFAYWYINGEAMYSLKGDVEKYLPNLINYLENSRGVDSAPFLELIEATDDSEMTGDLIDIPPLDIKKK